MQPPESAVFVGEAEAGQPRGSCLEAFPRRCAAAAAAAALARPPEVSVLFAADVRSNATCVQIWRQLADSRFL